MTQAATLSEEYALLSPSLSQTSTSSSTSSSAPSTSSSPFPSPLCAELCEPAVPGSCNSPPFSPSASLFLPPAKSTRSSLHKRSSSTASTASTTSSFSTSSPSSSCNVSYAGSPLPSTPPSMVEVLPPSPSRLRIDSGMVGLLHRFDSLLPSPALSPSSTASTAQKPPLSPLSGTRVGRNRVNRALCQQPPPPSPVVQSKLSRRTRSLAPQATGKSSSPLLSTRQLPLQPMLHPASSLPPLAVRSLSIPAHFRATSASSTLPQYAFRSIAHDVLSTGSPVSSPRMSAGPSRSPSPSTSPPHSSRRSSFSFHPLSPAHNGSSSTTAFFPPSISASPILLPQPNFDAPPPSPLPLATSPHPSSSPSPTPSPPTSPPTARWLGRGKLPLSGKTADGVAMVSCATVAELLRGREESKRRTQQMEDDKLPNHDGSIMPCEADTSCSSSSAASSPSSSCSSISTCSTPSPPPSSLPPFNTMFDDVIILDCRFPYEYNGGHIPSAINITSFAQLQDILFTATANSEAAGNANPGGEHESGAAATASGRTCLVFHCEFSQSRAPQYFSSLRRLNESSLASYTAGSSSSVSMEAAPICPSQLLSSCPYPDMYVMEGGYRRWVEEYADLCEPAGGYVEMRDRRWREECGKGLKERKQEKRGEMERKRRRQQHGSSATVDDDCLRRITRSSTAAASLTTGAVGGCSSAVDFNMASPVFRRTSSCSSLLSSAYSPIPLSLHDADGGYSAEKDERRSKREKR